MMDKKWYAIYVNSRHEKKVASLLESKLVEIFLPLQKKTKQWSDRKKIVLEPLFTSYLFVRIQETEKEKVRETSGVLNFVYWLGKPAVVRDEEIEIIRNFIDEFENIEVESDRLEISSNIRIESGPFMNQTGKIVDVNKHKIRIFVESLGCYLIADITKNKVLNLPANKR
jgi:transcription antitermination factor NusG